MRAGLPWRATQPVMPWPRRSLTSAASGGRPVEASISSRPLLGLMRATEPLVARIEPHGLLQNELQGLLRVEGGMDDVADLIKQLQPFVGGRNFELSGVRHRIESLGLEKNSSAQIGRASSARQRRTNPVRPKTRLGSQAARKGGKDPPTPRPMAKRCMIK